MTLDTIDRRLVALLQARGRAGFQELGEAVGLSGPAVFQRVRKLEAQGVITGYHARVDPAEVDRALVAFLRVRLGPDSDAGRLVKQWAAAAAVLECHRLTGDGGYLLKLRVSDVGRLGPHLDAARRAGCTVSVELGLGTEFERWSVSVSE